MPGSFCSTAWQVITNLALVKRPILRLRPWVSFGSWSADGLPVGFQIVGRPFEEATVLRAAAAFEAAQACQQRSPLLP